MRIEVNGEVREVTENCSLRDLVTALELAPERLAVELNGEVIGRGDWPQTFLAEGDRIEIVHFVGGGSRRASDLCFAFQLCKLFIRSALFL